MLTKLLHFWEYLRNSYWLVPAVLLFTVIVLSYSMLATDARIDLSQHRGFGWLVFTSADGARSVLSTIAASTFSAATLIFSVTMVTLSLTSSQFGPRLLRNFLRDPINQFTFGAFISTFVYCLLIMRGMVVAENRIPNLSISLAVVMVLFNAALFIGFIHHLTASIRVERMASDIGSEFIEIINRYLPEEYIETDNTLIDDDFQLKQTPSIIRANQSGYVQAINYSALISLAEAEEITIQVLFKPGHYVLSGIPLAKVWASVNSKDHITGPICSSFLLGNEPSGEQDLEFTIRQLVQIAARALSPGINDPFTAMTCIDCLATGLAVIAQRKLPEFRIRDDQGRLLLIKNELTFQNMCDASFVVIRQMSSANPPVAIYLLEILAQLAAIAKRQEDRDAIKQTAQLTFDAAFSLCPLEHDKQAIKQRLEQINSTLKTPEYYF